MTAALLVANHSTGDWAADFLLFMTPALVLAAVLWVWQRRDREKHANRDGSEPPEAH